MICQNKLHDNDRSSNNPLKLIDRWLRIIRKNLKKYTQIFYWVFIFLVSAVLLFLILPGEPKFKYEYQKGMPWRHDNLVAPFDFAILKSPAELDAEKAEQLKTVVPYFTYDTTVLETHLLAAKCRFKY